MVGTRQSLGGNDFAGERSHPPLHPVSNDGVADLAGDRESDSYLRVAVVPVTDQKDESGGRGAPSGVRREEVRAFLDYRERL